MSLITPAADNIGSPGEIGDAEYLGRLERASVAATLDNLMTFPDIRERVGAGDLKLLGAYFDVGSGVLRFTIRIPAHSLRPLNCRFNRRL